MTSQERVALDDLAEDLAAVALGDFRLMALLSSSAVEISVIFLVTYSEDFSEELSQTDLVREMISSSLCKYHLNNDISVLTERLNMLLSLTMMRRQDVHMRRIRRLR